MEVLRQGNYIRVREGKEETSFSLLGKHTVEKCIETVGKLVFDIVVENPNQWINKDTLQSKNT